MILFGVQPAASIVGRDGELGVLRGALRDAAAGRGRLALIAGEPGIGKTRIATELAATAAMQGFVALWARCPDAAGAPAFWPFRQIAREHRRHTQRGGDLAKLERHLAATAAHDDGAPEQARFALFERVASALRAAAEDAPLYLHPKHCVYAHLAKREWIGD